MNRSLKAVFSSVLRISKIKRLSAKSLFLMKEKNTISVLIVSLLTKKKDAKSTKLSGTLNARTASKEKAKVVSLLV